MSHKIFRLFFVVILVIGSFAIQVPQSARAAGPWYVATTGDDNNDCLSPGTACATINGATGKASSGDTIYVATGTYTGTGNEVVLLDKGATLSGGWNAGFTSQNGTSIIDGEEVRRGITINSATTILERFTIQNGFQNEYLSGGGGIYNNLGNVTLDNIAVIGNTSKGDFRGGGGIYNTGTMILNHSAITGNQADGYQSGGAGIYNQGTMTLNNSSVSSNRSGDNSGGGIYNSLDSSMTINNTTISNNIAGGGGGIENGGTMTINSTTISHNSALTGGGLISSSGSVTMQNSILAENKGLSPDCIFPPTSAGYNIIGDATSCNFNPTTGDQINIDPKIALLIGDPGYHPLLSNSPAIDSGNPTGCVGSAGLLNTDQRGALRSGTCDIGAYEYTTPGAATSLVVGSGSGQSAAPTFDFPKPLQVAALDNLGSPVSSVSVIFTAPSSGPSATFFDTGTDTTSVLTNEGGVATTSIFTANNQFGAYTISASASGVASVNFNLMNAAWYVTTTGNDSNSCSSSGSPCATINGAIGKAAEGDTVFVAAGTYIGSGTEVVLVNKSIRLIGGWDDGFVTHNGTSIIDGQGERQGMKVNIFTSAIIDRLTIQHGSGGGIGNFGMLTINSSMIKENAQGGILNLGMLTINNSSIINNTSNSGGGISNGSGGFALLAVANINNSTISGNLSDSRGGGINNESTGTMTLNNSTVYSNHDIFFPGGGGVYNNGGNVMLKNSILAGNSNSNGGGMDCNGTILSSGYNLLGNTFGCTFNSSAGDLTNVDPNLGQLIGPLGSPSYHPLFPSSPAIDAGNPASCTDQNGNILTTDQRGAARVGVCDTGAYEYTTPGPATSLSVVGGDSQSTTTTVAFPKPLQAAALDNQGSPVSGVPIDFTAPANGPSGTFVDTGTNTTSVNTNAGGVATTSIFTANDQEGAYNVSASATGLGTVNFNLEQITRAINDNFANAKEITLLPFSDSVDNTRTTIESGEPHFCGSAPETQSVWYAFTPDTNMAVVADMAGSSFSDANLTIFQAVGPRFDGLSFVDRACFGGSITLNVQGGTTYYIQAESHSSGGGDLHLNLQVIPPPVNDNFSDATTIGGLSFSDSQDITGATTEPNETQSCEGSTHTVWYTFTATVDSTLSADTAGSSFSDTMIGVYQAGGPGIGDLIFLQCSSFGRSVTFNTQAGVTYYFQAGSVFSSGGNLQFNLEEAIPPANDRFDSATVIPLPLPFDDIVETSAASIEEGEPTPSCAFFGLGSHSSWYAFTPDRSRSISAIIPSAAFTPVVAVYTANLVGDLTEVGCQNYGQPLTFRARAGTTYYLQVNNLYPSEQGGSIQFHLEISPPPVADFYFYPTNPTFFDTIQFYDTSYDPAQAGIQSYLWNFGDGTRSTEPNPTHQYATDGNYTVRHTIKTVDGRTASTTQVVHVKSNKVNIDIKPGARINRIVIGSSSDATVVVAILSTRNFNAPRQVDKNSLTFGHTGDEDSLNRTGSNLIPDCHARDVNNDDRNDLVCRFLIRNTGFQIGDTVGILKGLTIRGIQIQGRDSVVIIIRSLP